MPKSGRIAIILGLFVVAAAAAATFFVLAVRQPPSMDFTADHQSGRPVDITLQTVGSIGTGTQPTWVSYLTKSPGGDDWVHSTVWQVPAHTRVNVTIYQYDSGSPLRNQQLGRVQGTTGGLAYLNGKPFRLINANQGNGVGHTFSIPTLGISVPLYGNNGNANLCAVAPCTTSSPHNVVRFSFTSPGPGSYPWQCFVPCALGWLYGNGGPMQSLGYMDGFMNVVST